MIPAHLQVPRDSSEFSLISLLLSDCLCWLVCAAAWRASPVYRTNSLQNRTSDEGGKKNHFSALGWKKCLAFISPLWTSHQNSHPFPFFSSSFCAVESNRLRRSETTWPPWNGRRDSGGKWRALEAAHQFIQDTTATPTLTNNKDYFVWIYAPWRENTVASDFLFPPLSTVNQTSPSLQPKRLS